MERFQVARPLIGALLCAAVVTGCTNPFAPTLRGGGAPLWTDASTVGELLQNFQTAYQLADSLQYAELLDEDFQFQYYDPVLQRTEGWYRETDLRATSRMFRSFQNISLVWGGVSDSVKAIDIPGSLFDVRVQYQLILDDLTPVIGFARFTLYKEEDDRFRIVLWQDDV